MANAYSALYYHLVFSTKNRIESITPPLERRVWKALGAAASAHRMIPVRIGGIEDHVHVLLNAPRTLAPFQIAQFIKGSSSRWINLAIPELEGFAWQTGYGIFSVSRSAVNSTARYIANQRVHHSRYAFEEEYRRLLKMHNVTVDDPCFLWD